MARPSRPWYWKDRDAWFVTIGGKRHLLAKGKDARKEATAEFHRLMVADGNRVATSKVTAGELFDLFLDHVALLMSRGEREQVTYEGYVRHLTTAAERFGDVLASEVRPLHVHKWVDDPAKGWGPTTRNSAITAVKAVYRWAKRRGHLDANPLADVEKPTPRRREAIPTADQAKAIFEAAGPELRDLLTCLHATGCRPGELIGLEADKMDHDGGVWRVKDKIRRHTGSPTREVYPPAAAIAIGRRLAEVNPIGPAFLNSRGRPWTRNAMACAYRVIRKKTGLGSEVVGYALRHLWVTDALENGLPALTVATLAGHQSTRMIETRYSHLDDRRDHLKEQARKVRPENAAPEPRPAVADPD